MSEPVTVAVPVSTLKDALVLFDYSIVILREALARTPAHQDGVARILGKQIEDVEETIARFKELLKTCPSPTG